MLKVIGAIVFVVLAYTVLILTAGHLPPNYAVGAAIPGTVDRASCGVVGVSRQIGSGHEAARGICPRPDFAFTIPVHQFTRSLVTFSGHCATQHPSSLCP